MMISYKTRRIIRAVIVSLVIVFFAFLLFSIIRIIFPTSNTNNSQPNISGQELVNTSANRAVRMTVRGRIVANENFRSYQILIAPNRRNLTVYSGYLNQPINNISLDNNIPAYEQFVYALNRAGLMDRDELTGDSNDVRGICATGLLYEFEMIEADKTIKKLWSSSCSGSRGSLGANITRFTNLFTLQIPDAQSAIGGVWQ